MKQVRHSSIVFSLIVLLIGLIALFQVEVVNAQEVPTDDQVNVIAKQLYCPVCENIPLDVCPTQACAQWRELIREKLSAGWTEAEIKTYFVAQYGDRVLASPPATGLNWLVYIIPPLVIIAGAYILYRALLSWRQAPAQLPEQNQPEDETDDEYVAQIEEELRRQ
ncbi:MAG: cytochrome c-type biogenesis protein [Anaerolineales bacterium]